MAAEMDRRWRSRLTGSTKRGSAAQVLSEVCLENDLEVQNALERVQEALDGINEGYAQVVYAVCVLGMSDREASDCLNVPMGTIMSRLNRARKEIRDAKE